jgi:hypothetical protein
MRFAPAARLVPMASLVFVLGGLAGWSSVMTLRGCVGVGRIDPSVQASPGTEAPGPTGGGEAAGVPPAEEQGGQAGGRDAQAPDGATAAMPPLPDGVPHGRAIAALGAEPCFEWLDTLGIDHERDPEVEGAALDQVAAPLRLLGPIAGVTYAHVGRSPTHELIDCRLVVALAHWGRLLRAAGVTRVEHMSVFRPEARVNGTAKPSAHATALAMDTARFHLEDGTELDVLEDWADKKRGAPPCDEREGEPEAQALLRRLVCEAVDDDLFQVVITPHHNRAHRNHVHVEIVPDVDWSFIR